MPESTIAWGSSMRTATDLTGSTSSPVASSVNVMSSAAKPSYCTSAVSSLSATAFSSSSAVSMVTLSLGCTPSAKAPSGAVTMTFIVSPSVSSAAVYSTLPSDSSFSVTSATGSSVGAGVVSGSVAASGSGVDSGSSSVTSDAAGVSVGAGVLSVLAAVWSSPDALPEDTISSCVWGSDSTEETACDTADEESPECSFSAKAAPARLNVRQSASNALSTLFFMIVHSLIWATKPALCRTICFVGLPADGHLLGFQQLIVDLALQAFHRFMDFGLGHLI